MYDHERRLSDVSVTFKRRRKSGEVRPLISGRIHMPMVAVDSY